MQSLLRRCNLFLGSSRASPNLNLNKLRGSRVPVFPLMKFKFAVKKPKSFKGVPELHFAKNGRSNFEGVAWETDGVYRIYCNSLGESMCSKRFFPRASEHRVLPIVGVCISSSHLHTFSSSHLLIFTPSLTPSHLHICSSSHLLIFTSAHLHICSSSHLLIFTSAAAHLHICSSSHLLIFTSSYLHTFSSSHLLIFTSAHLHICSSSHLLILTSSYLHIFSSSHLHILTSSLSLSLSLSPSSFLSPFSLSLSLSLLSLSLFSLSPSLSFSCHLGVTCRTCKPLSSHCCIGRADSHQINLKYTGTRLQGQGHTGEIPMHMPEAGHIEAQMIRTYCSEMSISSTRKRLGPQRIKILLKYFWTRAICTVVKKVLSGAMPQMYKQGGNCKY